MKDEMDDNNMDLQPVRRSYTDEDDIKVTSNTLDYYNDDMSRRAVGKLFDDSSEEDGLVKGYSKPTLTREAPPPARSVETRQRRQVMDDDETNYDFSLYRRKEKKIGQPNEMLEEPPIQPVRKAPTPEQSNHYKPPQKKIMQKREFEEEYEEDDFDEYEGDEGYDEYEEATVSLGKKSVAMIAFAVFFVSVLIVFAVLIFKINSLNTQLEQAQVLVGDDSVTDEKMNELKFTIDELQEKNDELTTALANANTVPESTTPDPAEGEENMESPTGQGGTQTTSGTTSGTPTTTAENTTYTVVSGDNLGKISNKFYGSLNDYKKIMDANGLTNENISVGQVLVIPE